MPFGVNLKRERELRGITLEEISKATKVSVRLLEAIESDRFDVLPEGLFRKSFIKSYAKYLGMNEEQVLQEYALQNASRATPAAQQEKSHPRAIATVTLSPKKAIGIALGAVAAIGLGFYLFTDHGRGRSVPDSPKPTSRNLPAAEIPSPGSASTNQHPPQPTQKQPIPGKIESGSQAQKEGSSQPSLRVLGELAKPASPSTAAPAPTAGEPELVIHASQPTWLSVNSANKELAFTGLLKAQDTKSLSLQSPLKIVVGNAGGVTLQVNGQTFRRLGDAGEAITLEISKENYQKYLEKQSQ